MVLTVYVSQLSQFDRKETFIYDEKSCLCITVYLKTARDVSMHKRANIDIKSVTLRKICYSKTLSAQVVVEKVEGSEREKNEKERKMPMILFAICAGINSNLNSISKPFQDVVVYKTNKL